MNKARDLRLSIQRKLKERRRLLSENYSMRSEVERMRAGMKSRALAYHLDHCGDAIIAEILKQSVDVAKVVTEETRETGSYLVEVHVPSFTIRQHVLRSELELAGDLSPDDEIKVKHITVGEHQ